MQIGTDPLRGIDPRILHGNAPYDRSFRHLDSWS
jgi:hypothetical protein